ncbi:MAG: GntR family transcriptional regulator [Acidimicrobiia bacterium]|nr:GntR family transcriptional regulator [Acidimicrobiia bacterium]
MIEFHPSDGVPLYLQIASSIRRAMREAQISDGDRLPAARDLAESLGVHMHTVVRAYGILRDEGLLDVRRGRGATVRVGSADAAEVAHLVSELVAAARHQGLELQELIDLITKEHS